MEKQRNLTCGVKLIDDQAPLKESSKNENIVANCNEENLESKIEERQTLLHSQNQKISQVPISDRNQMQTSGGRFNQLYTCGIALKSLSQSTDKAIAPLQLQSISTSLSNSKAIFRVEKVNNSYNALWQVQTLQELRQQLQNIFNGNNIDKTKILLKRLNKYIRNNLKHQNEDYQLSNHDQKQIHKIVNRIRSSSDCKKKSKEQSKMLKLAFQHNPIWNKKFIEQLSKKIGLCEVKIYKWNWDRSKKLRKEQRVLSKMSKMKPFKLMKKKEDISSQINSQTNKDLQETMMTIQRSDF
eukprot:403354946